MHLQGEFAKIIISVDYLSYSTFFSLFLPRMSLLYHGFRYNVPGRTSSNILPATIARLSECPNIVAVKEASGSLDQAAEIKRTTRDDFLLYSAEDDQVPVRGLVPGHGLRRAAGQALDHHL